MKLLKAIASFAAISSLTIATVTPGAIAEEPQHGRHDDAHREGDHRDHGDRRHHDNYREYHRDDYDRRSYSERNDDDLYGGTQAWSRHDRHRNEIRERHHDNGYNNTRRYYSNYNYDRQWERAHRNFDRSHNNYTRYRTFYTRGNAPHYHSHNDHLFCPYHSGTSYYIGGQYYSGPSTVVIRDYHRHGLHAPPRGYHWVHDRDRGDAVLASVATGAIIGLVVGAILTDDW